MHVLLFLIRMLTDDINLVNSLTDNILYAVKIILFELKLNDISLVNLFKNTVSQCFILFYTLKIN